MSRAAAGPPPLVAAVVSIVAAGHGSDPEMARFAGDVRSAELRAGAVEGPAPAPHASEEAPGAAPPGAAPAAAASGEVPVRLSLDESAEVLTVQMVTPDAVVVPLWRYERLGS